MNRLLAGILAVPLLASAAAAQDLLQVEDQRAVHRVAFSPDGKLLASAGSDYMVRLWDVGAKKLTATLKGHTGDVNGIIFSPDGKRLYSGELYKHVKTWDVATQKAVKSVELPGGTYCFAITSDGKKVYVGSREPWVYLWDPEAAAETEVAKLRSDNDVWGVGVTKDAKFVVHSDGGGGVFFWDGATGAPLKQQKHGNITTGLSIAPDDKLVVTVGGDGSVKQWVVATGEPVEKFAPPAIEDIRSVVYKKDGKLIYVGLGDGKLKVLDAVTGAVTKEVPAHEGPIMSIAVSPDGKTIATGSMDTSIKLWPAP